MSITEFLLARIAEDEEAAYHASGLLGIESAWWTYTNLRTVFARLTMADAAHIARHDPTRVLRECEAKRELVDGWHDEHGGGHVLKTLAAVYSDHPDYNPNWAP